MTRMLVVLAVLAVALLWASPAPAQDISRGHVPQMVGGRLPDGGAAVISLDSSGHALTSTTFRGCSSVVVKVTSCGTTAGAVPATRTAGSKSLEIVNSPENAGSPKVKCIANPEDGGVGFGATYPGLVRVPGESLVFALDSTHTVICVCDTPATAVTTTECVP